MRRSRAQATPAAVVEKETAGADVGTGAAMEVVDLRRQTNADGVASWATGLVSVGPNRRKSRPTRSKMKRHP
jgi:hypothetical protein